MTFASEAGALAAFSVPARSTQSRLRMTSAAASAAKALGVGREHRRRAEMQRMVGREARAAFEIGDDARAERFGELHARVPGVEAA